jgi:hypothetical protein
LFPAFCFDIGVFPSNMEIQTPFVEKKIAVVTMSLGGHLLLEGKESIFQSKRPMLRKPNINHYG